MKLVKILLWGWTILMLIVAWPAAIMPLVISAFVTTTAGDAAYAKGDDSVQSYLEYLKWRFYSKKNR